MKTFAALAVLTAISLILGWSLWATVTLGLVTCICLMGLLVAGVENYFTWSNGDDELYIDVDALVKNTLLMVFGLIAIIVWRYIVLLPLKQTAVVADQKLGHRSPEWLKTTVYALESAYINAEP